MKKRKANKNRHVVFSNAWEEDMTSKLPEDLIISQMLLHLPTKESVKTCVLSNRWKSLWLSVPALDLDTNQFPDYNSFVSFVDRFLDFSKGEKSCLHKLDLVIRKDDENNDQSCLTRWIDIAATSKLRHLDVESLVLKRQCFEVMPLSLYICKTLIFLRLRQVSIGSFDSVSLPCVKTLSLEHNVYANEECMKSLISSCPVLEDLSIVRTVDDNANVIRVHSQTLTSLIIDVEPGEGEDEYFDYENSGFVIDAPRLKYLHLEDESSASKIISNSGSLTSVTLLGVFSIRDSVGEVDLRKQFFTSISGVREMKFSTYVFEFIKHERVPLPRFRNLLCLEAELFLSYIDYMLTFLESCPNLKSLILNLGASFFLEQARLSSVPHCLFSSLEFLEIRLSSDLVALKEKLDYKENFEALLKVARYFAEKSVLLKDFVVRLESSTRKKYPDVFRDLLALPSQSSTCQIVVYYH